MSKHWEIEKLKNRNIVQLKNQKNPRKRKIKHRKIETSRNQNIDFEIEKWGRRKMEKSKN